MTLFDSIFLAILQGLTEFLPVSSSGHLTLFQHYLKVQNAPLIFDIILHVASLLAVMIFFRRKIISLIKAAIDILILFYIKLFKNNLEEKKNSIKSEKQERVEIGFLLLSTAITVAFVPLTKPIVLYLKKDPKFLLFAFLFTAIILLIADYLMKRNTGSEKITLKNSIIIGFFQALAVIPGVSRSGSTICGGLISGTTSKKAVEYSFILAIPAILGAAILEYDSTLIQSIPVTILIAGFIVSFITSLGALRLLVFMVEKTMLKPFAFYLIILSSIVIYQFWI